MVTLSFTRRDTEVEILRLAVSEGEQPRSLRGDVSWLDFGFEPASAALGRPVSLREDAEEWARALPAAYASSPIEVVVVPGTLAPPLPTSYASSHVEVAVVVPTPAVAQSDRAFRLVPRASEQSQTRLASEDVIINAPMSYAGSFQRIMRFRRRHTTDGWKQVALLLWVIVCVLVMWSVITVWYLIFGLWLVPYRLLRRGARKRKAEALRHRELIGTIQGTSAASSAMDRFARSPSDWTS